MGQFRCTTTFAAGRRIVNVGDILPSDDQIIRGREHLFQDINTAKPPAVKPARTAAPKPAKAAAKKAGGTKKAAGPPTTS